MDLLNLLTAYQKKHLVEFLPYHECDAPSRQAPDLDCLVKLQAQHTQLRHIIFLTGTCMNTHSDGILFIYPMFVYYSVKFYLFTLLN